jgi:putative N6-adenine-specific DNA methylase
MSNEYNFCVPCLFGLEGICADELRRLEMDNVRAVNGQVLFSGKARDIARANINIRTGERVLLIIGEANAFTFDELFESVRAMPWEEFIPVDGEFPVKGHALNSKLASIPDCQKIVKKAIVERLKSKYRIDWFKETGEKYQVQFSIMNDVATLYIDTSGAGLHKRGYRLKGNAAPLRETLAAAIVKLSRYRGREAVCDPFCGSGTIPIEAALIALNRAPGLMRDFSAKKWKWPDNEIWTEAVTEAKSREFDGDYDIWGGDIDSSCIKTSVENAKRANVDNHIRFEVSEATTFHREISGGIILTNPPYGERVMLPREAEMIYREFGKVTRNLDNWKMYILSSNTEFERIFAKKATKKRKLYNGMKKCDLYMYF